MTMAKIKGITVSIKEKKVGDTLLDLIETNEKLLEEHRLDYTRMNEQLDKFNKQLMKWNLDYVHTEGLYDALLKQFDGDEDRVMEIGKAILHDK